jgi:hypothetical protein
MTVPVIKVSPVLKAKLAEIDEMLEDAVERKMTDVARTIVLASPVDTGAFVNSWSFKDNLGGGRSKSSENKPRGRDAGAERGKALNNLVNDIKKTVEVGSPGGPVKEGIGIQADNYYFLNRAPHARDVDNNPKHQVVDKVIRQHGR